MSEERWFPIINSDYRDLWAAVRETQQPFVVAGLPWAMLEPHEPQAIRNHDQTLLELARRGGLSACEMLAVLEDRPWERMSLSVANEKLVSLYLAYRTLTPSPATGSD